MSDGDAIDAMMERLAREEQDNLDRAHGEALLAAADFAGSEAQQQANEQILRDIAQAHSAKQSQRSEEDNEQ